MSNMECFLKAEFSAICPLFPMHRRARSGKTPQKGSGAMRLFSVVLMLAYLGVAALAAGL
jgi:hypothetical protein